MGHGRCWQCCALHWRLAQRLYTVAIKLQTTILFQPHLAAHEAIEPANLNRWVVSISTTMKPMFGALKKSGYVRVGASLAGVCALCFTETARDWSLCMHAVKYFSPTSRLCMIRTSHGAKQRAHWAAFVLRRHGWGR